MYKLNTTTSFLFLLFFIAAFQSKAATYDPKLEWKSFETDNFIFHYDSSLRHLVQSLAPRAEEIHQTLNQTFDWQPWEKTHVVLTDKIDNTNGTATVLYSNQIVLYTSPPYEPFGLENFDNWLEMVFIHEYTHILHLDMSSGLPKHLRWVLGRYFLLFPNAFMPRWLIEGIATYVETDNTTHTGRGNSTYFKALMRMEIENGFLSAGNASQVMESWPGLTRWYLYGVYWFKFLEEKYGQEKILELLKKQSGFPVPYLPDVGAWLTLDKTIVGLWSEFENYIQQEFEQELAQLKQNQWQSGKNITQTGFYNRNPIFIDKDTILYSANDGEDSTWLTAYELDSNTHQRIRRIYGHRFDYHPERGVLIAQQQIYSNVNVYTDLYIIDIEKNTQKQITRAQRFLFASWSPDGQKIAGVKLKQAKHQLQILDIDGTPLQTIPLPENSIINSIDWSPNGEKLIASIWQSDYRWQLQEFHLQSQKWEKLTQNNTFEFFAKYLDDDRILYSADYEATYNAYILDKTTMKHKRLTHVVGAAYFPDLYQDKLAYSGMNEKGFDIYLSDIKERRDTSQVKPQKALSHPDISSNAEVLNPDKERDYSALQYVTPRWWFPNYFYSSDSHYIGFSTAAFDHLAWHTYAANLNYDIKRERPFGSLSYVWNRWYPSLGVTARRNFGVQTELDSLDFVMSIPWLKRDYRWLGYTGISYTESEYLFLNGNTEELSIEDNSSNLYGIGLNFSNLKRNSYTVAPHSGIFTNLKLERLDQRPLFNPSYNTNLYAAAFSPLFLRTTINLKTFLGLSDDTTRPYVLFGTDRYETGGKTTDFGRRSFRLRGYGTTNLDNREGNVIQYFGLDWHFPVARVENGFVFPPIGLIRIQGNLFAEMGRAWFSDTDTHQNLLIDTGRQLLSSNNNAPRFSRSIGGEVTFLTSIFFAGACEYAVGISRGLDEGGEIQSYFFIGCN